MLDIDPQGSFSAWVGFQKRFSKLPPEGRRAEAERLVEQARIAIDEQKIIRGAGGGKVCPERNCVK